MNTWQEREKGNVCQEFAKFVDSWDEEKTSIKCLYHEKNKRSTIFDMSADDVKFSFRRVGFKYSILFNGQSEFIQQETYAFFKDICEQYIRHIKSATIH
ncbi:MAG: hypothetical protein VX125_07930 [Pseudomonadota bacterium]|nr:hypothetical protein [Pseudomonadota bacterium]